MPLRKYVPRRGNPPLLFFKGSRRELRTLTPAVITSYIHKAGGKKFTPRMGGLIKKTVQQKVSELIQIRKKDNSDKQKISGFVIVPFLAPKSIVLKVSISSTGSVSVTQHPLTHGVRTKDTPLFDTLISILKNGFKGSGLPNTYLPPLGRKTTASSVHSANGITRGDRYGIEMMTSFGDDHYSHASVLSATPRQIIAINIQLDSKATPSELKNKKAFYTKRLQPYHIPFRYVTE